MKKVIRQHNKIHSDVMLVLRRRLKHASSKFLNCWKYIYSILEAVTITSSHKIGGYGDVRPRIERVPASSKTKIFWNLVTVFGTHENNDFWTENLKSLK